MNGSAGTVIRVVIVDDHPMLREGTRQCLERASGIVVVGEAGSGREALQLVAVHRPDVLLLDLRLPDMSGAEVARQVRKDFPETAVVVLTAYGSLGALQAMRALGVRGFLEKTASGDEIVEAVRRAVRGQSWSSLARSEVAWGEPLTPREHEVLRLLAAGRRNAEIAQTLGISVKTVEYHVSNLFAKLGARSRVEAIRLAHAAGLLPLEDVEHGLD